VFVLSCFLLCAFADKKSYRGYQVIRVFFSGNASDVVSQMFALNTMAEEHLLDVWAANAFQGWMDIMIPPRLTASLNKLVPAHLPYVVRIEDVQAQIDESEIDMANAHLRRDVEQNDPIFNNFQSNAAINAWLNTKVSDRATLASIGNSHLNVAINSLTIRNPATQNPRTIIIHCGIHAREWITPPHCLWAIDQLTNINNPDADRLLDTFQFVIIPVFNVDGYIYTHTTDRMWRKNRRPNTGSTCVGTDLNRNYGVGWSGPGASNNPCSETFYGPARFSGPETAHIRDLVDYYIADGSLVSYWDLHAYGAMWMSAYGYTCQLPPDFTEMNQVMTLATQACYEENGRSYAYGSICNTIYQASGSSVDWAYQGFPTRERIVHSYTTEAFGNSFIAPVSQIVPIAREIWAGIVRTADYIAGQIKRGEI